MSSLVVLLGVAVFLGAILLAFRAGLAALKPGGDYLCDTCKYNDVRYCTQPDRPNARACPDYKAR